MSTKKSGMEQLRHELLTDIADHVKITLSGHGVNTDLAEQAGVALASFLAVHWGGQLVNFPKDYAFEIAKRDLEIYDAFTGNNHSALARQFNVSVRTIYNIVKRVQQFRVNEEQISLF